MKSCGSCNQNLQFDTELYDEALWRGHNCSHMWPLEECLKATVVKFWARSCSHILFFKAGQVLGDYLYCFVGQWLS